MSDSDILLVFAAEYGPDQHFKNNWLVALRRNGRASGARRSACRPTHLDLSVVS